MFVRWQSRRRRRSVFGHGTGDVNWKAVLVESARVNGGPTYRHISYLGSIAESAMEIPAQRRFFWSHALKQLDDLGSRTSPEDCQRSLTAVPFIADFKRPIVCSNSRSSCSPQCCFCERDTGEVRKMVTGSRPGAAICGQCVELAQRALVDSHAKP
jgi:hypothetical protein